MNAGGCQLWMGGTVWGWFVSDIGEGLMACFLLFAESEDLDP